MNFEKKCKEILSETIESIKNFDWSSEEHYALWSAQTYHYVKHSTRLFALASARCPLDGNSLHLRYIDHLLQEKQHEKLSLMDLKELGYGIDEFEELSSTKALYQSQYYLIEHEHAYSFFGYLLALEGLAVYVGKEIYQKVLNAHGEKASRFLKLHIEEDESHLSSVYKWFERFDGEHKDLIVKNLKQSSETYSHIIFSISESLNKRVKQAA